MPAADPRGLPALVEEAQRMLAICNACRYCEGYCAVFPALERRLAFDARDVHYLASLCHNCGSCLTACQYAPPHEFQLDFPRMLAQVRPHTYRQFAWPAFLGAAFARNGVVTALACALALALFLLGAAAAIDPAVLFGAHPDAEGAFYAVLPHGFMAGLFGAVALYGVLALGIPFVRFWPGMGEDWSHFARAGSLREALADAFALRYLDGGGEGCTYPREAPSFARRNFHHLTFYGFLLCFAATSVATVYHYGFGWKAPYALWSVPVALGTAGGLGLVVGPIGLAVLRARRDPLLGDPDQAGMDGGFLALLVATSVTGLALLALRETRAMGVVLLVHLATVLALFVTMPYGKFVHALYRLAALVRFHVERRRPVPGMGSE